MCGQPFLLKVHPDPPDLRVSFESKGLPVRVNSFKIMIGSEVHQERNIALKHTEEKEFDEWKENLNEDGNLEVVAEWTVIETKTQCTVVVNKIEDLSTENTSVKSWVLENIFRDGMADTDFTLVCKDGVEVPVHMMIMKGASDFFKAMMKPDNLEAKEGRGNIDCGSGVGQGLVSFVYTGEVNAETFDRNLIEFLKVADEYNLIQLKEKAEQRMLSKLNVSNMIEYAIAGNNYNANKLKTMSKTLVRANLGKLRTEKDWKKKFDSQKDLLIEILDMD